MENLIKPFYIKYTTTKNGGSMEISATKKKGFKIHPVFTKLKEGNP